MERIRVPAEEVVRWTTSRVEETITILAKEPWIESDATVVWKRPAGSNSEGLTPVVVVRGVQLDANNVAGFLFGDGMPCFYMSQKWREVKATIEDQDLFYVHWETALSLAAARICSPFGWATYDQETRNMKMLQAWTYLLTHPRKALGI